jgi:Omp85 superfamily domain
VTRTVLIALAVLLAAPAAAQDAVPPRFFIERIEVRDARRVSPDVVIAESRLREGQEYSEVDLRDASSRLSRLPFLLSAEFSLEKGSERGRFVLVVTINETKPFFYAIDFRPVIANGTVEVDYSDRIPDEGAGTLGFRWFVGRRGAIHLALVTSQYSNDFADDYGGIAAGYTQYDLFGTRAFATLSLKYVVGEVSAGGAISPQLVVGVPLSANQTLTVEVDETHYTDNTREVLNQRFDVQRSQRVAGATWSYNTTNRPFLPTRGTLLSVRPRVSWSDSATYVIFVEGPPPFPPAEVRADTVHTQARQLGAKAARYWELSERTSVSTSIEGTWTHFVADSDVFGNRADHVTHAVIAGGYSYSLWDATRQRTGDSRLELNGRIGNRSVAYYDFADVDQRQVSASWVRRSSWGTLRLGAGYAW